MFSRLARLVLTLSNNASLAFLPILVELRRDTPAATALIPPRAANAPHPTPGINVNAIEAASSGLSPTHFRAAAGRSRSSTPSGALTAS